MEKQRVLFFVVSLLLGLTLPSVSFADKLKPCYNCSDCTEKLTYTSVFLANDIIDTFNSRDTSTDTECILIESSYDFDGNGKTIWGNNKNRRVGIRLKNASFAKVENVTVRNFGPTLMPQGMRPENAQVSVYNSSWCVLDEVKVAGGSNGIVLWGRNTYNNRVLDCEAYGAAWSGMAIWYGAHDNEINGGRVDGNKEGVTVCENQVVGGVSYFTEDNDVIGVKIWRNQHWNLCICHRSYHNWIQDNSIEMFYDVGNPVDPRRDIHNESDTNEGEGNKCRPGAEYVGEWVDLDRPGAGKEGPGCRYDYHPTPPPPLSGN